ncbi:Cytochrome oxidase biogenesis protein Sco1/SenC/PrrC, putative copper metallochaperone [Salisediminibacterium beveridgei]|uniref:Cytochrome oxidase biogenesis protein Sco1/SenC/PrrC, putative copper metallochaperone n=1 Tax=Salisediminibacterium beveridgei TaxID=632773 RepID=A0A1D7QWK4_9BACI|nr:Cytochrome oxidase biogenesis protein Sco1/SenC/PrrC, putative copper metallochaperone [Salisediminibacterium beveridgei]
MISGCSFLYEDVSESGQAETIIDVTTSETPWEMVSFEAVNQDGEDRSDAYYEGEWWIAKTIFTRCPTVCMVMTPNMVSLQEELDNQETDLQIVSFTVDPEFDDPDQLTEYGESYGADFSNWDFLTGYDDEMIRDLVLESFKAQVMELPEQSDIMHPVRFYLINPEGQIVRMYTGESNFDLDATVEDIQQMLDE